MNKAIFQDQGLFGNLGSSYIFWIILILIIAFIIYSGIKKNKKEKKSRKKRETEVKNLIKKHLKEHNNLKNVGIKYLHVLPRSGRKYKTRDIYDVFIEINDHKNNKLITRKVYEIEGIARNLTEEEKTSKKRKEGEDFVIDWNINREFNYRKHFQILQKPVKSKLAIYFKSLKRKNPWTYIKQQKTMKKNQELAKKKLDKDLKKIEEKQEIFQPKKKNNKNE